MNSEAENRTKYKSSDMIYGENRQEDISLCGLEYVTHCLYCKVDRHSDILFLGAVWIGNFAQSCFSGYDHLD